VLGTGPLSGHALVYFRDMPTHLDHVCTVSHFSILHLLLLELKGHGTENNKGVNYGITTQHSGVGRARVRGVRWVRIVSVGSVTGGSGVGQTWVRIVSGECRRGVRRGEGTRFAPGGKGHVSDRGVGGDTFQTREGNGHVSPQWGKGHISDQGGNGHVSHHLEKGYIADHGGHAFVQLLATPFSIAGGGEM